MSVLAILLTVGVGNAWVDAAEIYKETFGSTNSNTIFASYSGFTATTSMFSTSGTVTSHYSGSGSVGRNNLAAANLSSGYTGASGLSGCYHGGAANTQATIIQISDIDISGYSNLHLSFGAKGGSNNHKVNVTYKIDNGSETSLISNGSLSSTSWTLKEADISGTGSSLTIYIKHTPTNAWTMRIDDIILTGCPAPKTLTNGTITTSTAHLSWADDDDTGSYQVYCSTNNTTPGANQTPTTTVTTKYVDLSNLSESTEYFWWVRSKCSNSNKSAWVAGTSFTTASDASCADPAAPGNSSVSGTSATISTSSSAANYDLYLSTSSTAPTTQDPTDTIKNRNTKTIKGLDYGTTYYYWIRQNCGSSTSNWVAGSPASFTTASLSSISVSTAPTKTTYLVGDNFDPTGLVITRTFSDNSTDTYSYVGREGEFSFSPTTATALTAEDASVTITYDGKTASQAINVYTVTVNKVNMNGDAISAAGVTASCSGRTLSQSVGSTDYSFDSWVVTAGGVTISTNTITGTPTGNVTINAKFHEPITVTWKVNDTPYTTGDPTGSVKYGTAWSALNLPIDPSPTCGDVFVGWSTDEIGITGLDKDVPADATRIGNLNLMTSANQSGKSTTITGNTVFHAVFADYTTE